MIGEDEDAFWLFRISVDGKPRTDVWAPEFKRNWVLWQLSKAVIAYKDHGQVSVERRINDNWEKADDWRKLAH